MTPFLRYATLFITSLITFGIHAQDCSGVIKENKKISGVQIVRSDLITIVVRGGYNYGIEFFTDEKGIYARMTSVGGIEFNQDDQVAFVDFSGKERIYKFINLGEVVPGNVPTHRNNLQLDLEAINWLSGTTITGVNLINFVDRQKYKFTINPNRQSEFRNLCVCFSNVLETAAVKDTPGAAVACKKPSQADGGTASAGTAPRALDEDRRPPGEGCANGVRGRHGGRAHPHRRNDRRNAGIKFYSPYRHSQSTE